MSVATLRGALEREVALGVLAGTPLPQLSDFQREKLGTWGVREEEAAAAAYAALTTIASDHGPRLVREHLNGARLLYGPKVVPSAQGGRLTLQIDGDPRIFWLHVLDGMARPVLFWYVLRGMVTDAP